MNKYATGWDENRELTIEEILGERVDQLLREKARFIAQITDLELQLIQKDLLIHLAQYGGKADEVGADLSRDMMSHADVL